MVKMKLVKVPPFKVADGDQSDESAAKQMQLGGAVVKQQRGEPPSTYTRVGCLSTAGVLSD